MMLLIMPDKSSDKDKDKDDDLEVIQIYQKLQMVFNKKAGIKYQKIKSGEIIWNLQRIDGKTSPC
jgi:hypothetical protein